MGKEEGSENGVPRDIGGRLSRLSVIDRAKLRDLLEEAISESDANAETQDPDLREETMARNDILRRSLDFLLG